MEFVARTVAKITGDARRALDICRYAGILGTLRHAHLRSSRAVETVEVENENRRLVEQPTRLVTIADVQAIIKEMSASGPCLWIQKASLHQRILLLALSRCVKKQGQDQIKFGDVCSLSILLDFALTLLIAHPMAFDLLTPNRHSTCPESRPILQHALVFVSYEIGYYRKQQTGPISTCKARCSR